MGPTLTAVATGSPGRVLPMAYRRCRCHPLPEWQQPLTRSPHCLGHPPCSPRGVPLTAKKASPWMKGGTACPSSSPISRVGALQKLVTSLLIWQLAGVVEPGGSGKCSQLQPILWFPDSSLNSSAFVSHCMHCDLEGCHSPRSRENNILKELNGYVVDSTP